MLGAHPGALVQEQLVRVATKCGRCTQGAGHLGAPGGGASSAQRAWETEAQRHELTWPRGRQPRAGPGSPSGPRSHFTGIQGPASLGQSREHWTSSPSQSPTLALREKTQHLSLQTLMSSHGNISGSLAHPSQGPLRCLKCGWRENST